MKLFSRNRATPPAHLLSVKKTISADSALHSQLWSCVSLSRTQFKTHYLTASNRFARYFQSQDRLNTALQSAVNQLQESLISRLPHDRDREESARFEQVWKFTCFLQPLLKEAMATDRRWYNNRQQEIASFMDAAYYRDHSGPVRQSFIKLNLLNFLHPFSTDWLMQDELRCVDLLYRCIDDMATQATKQKLNNSIIDKRSQITPAADAIPSPVAQQKPIEKKARQENEEQENSTAHGSIHSEQTTPNNRQETPSTPTELPMSPEFGADLFKRFMAWLPEDAQLLKDDIPYIESPHTIERFINDNHLEVSVGEVQQLLLQHGFVRELISVGKKKRISGLRIPEDAHV
jgi:hypothetical protein